MVGILLVTHYGLGENLLECATHVMSRPLPHVGWIAVGRQDDPDAVLAEAQARIQALDDGAGVLVLTDMIGGTPSNIANRLIEPGRIEAVAGVNLPMLVRAACYSERPLDVVVMKAVTGGLEGVMYMLPPQTGKP